MNSTHLRRVIAAGMIGNVLEWYDFAIYGYFAAQIGRQFFPHEDAVAQLLSTFGIFAVGYLMRPIGGSASRAYWRYLRTPRRAHLLCCRNGDSDLSNRLVAGLSEDWPSRACRADRAAHCAGARCRRRIYKLDGVLGRAGSGRASRLDGCAGGLWRNSRHSAWLGSWRSLRGQHVDLSA